MASSYPLIDKLLNEKLYDHPVKGFHIIETHVSWVILTGVYAYKIKKAVDFQFLNFTTLEKRQYYCNKELTLNKRLAPEVYIEVVEITGTMESPQWQGDGPVIEYALKMHEFSQADILNELIKHDRITLENIQEIGRILARFHLTADRDGPKELGTTVQVHEPVIQNFEQIRPLLKEPNEIKRIDHLEEWANHQHYRWQHVFNARKQQGFIRECHGDVHLGNITLIKGKPVIFDCIEFNEPFRWTDTMADLGFLVMDLHDQNRYDFANHLTNVYLEETQDYQGLQILPYYQAYRAVVRAKITLFELTYTDSDANKKQMLWQNYQRIIALALSYIHRPKPFLLIMSGISGSGKTHIASELATQMGAIQIRSDSIRKGLLSLDLRAKTHSGINENVYAQDITDNTYNSLTELAELVIQAKYPVIADATYLKTNQRQQMIALANRLHVPYLFIDCQPPIEKVKAWLANRKHDPYEISEAGEAVIEMQLNSLECFSATERAKALTIDTATPKPISDMVAEIHKLLEQ